MNLRIKNVLTETLITHDNNKRVAREVTTMFEGTNFKGNQSVITESVDLLINGSKGSFLNHLFESADMFDALLDICVLNFSSQNAKLGGSITTFSLPAGWSCPFADTCLKKVGRDRVIDPEKVGTTHTSKRTGKELPYIGNVDVEKGENATHDCYAANQEMQHDAVRLNRWHNYDLLNEAGDYKAQAELIVRSLKYFFDNDGVTSGVRIHESGDFYTGEYLKAWMEVAKQMPNTHFYAYTKSIPFIKKHEAQLKSITNLSITLSAGGKRDRDLADTDFKEAKVFNSPEEILDANLLLDLDDNLAQERGGKELNFGLLVHGTQEAGEMSQTKRRNETFMAYWKYRDLLNRNLGKDENYFLSKDDANDLLTRIKDREDKSRNLKFITKLLNYVVKYHNYEFPEELVNILQPKYKP